MGMDSNFFSALSRNSSSHGVFGQARAGVELVVDVVGEVALGLVDARDRVGDGVLRFEKIGGFRHGGFRRWRVRF
jgi:hypothetical protein